MKLKVGQEVDIEADKRYLQHSRGHAIGDVYDALAELVTNADDSYGRLFAQHLREADGGPILVEHCEQRGGARSRIVVRDRAAGMDADDMARKLAKAGAYSSSAGSRGYMGRGAKDCTALGDVIFESIKDDRFYRARMSHDLKLRLEVERRASAKDRDDLGLAHGNGTSVTIELLPEVKLPRTVSLRRSFHGTTRSVTSWALKGRQGCSFESSGVTR